MSIRVRVGWVLLLAALLGLVGCAGWPARKSASVPRSVSMAPHQIDQLQLSRLAGFSQPLLPLGPEPSGAERNALAAAILSILGAPDRAALMGERGRERVRRQCSPARAAQAIVGKPPKE